MLTKERRARILWQCRRGMLELDLILEKIVRERLDEMNEEATQAFEHLLEYTDPELFAWFMGHEAPPSEDVREALDRIQA